MITGFRSRQWLDYNGKIFQTDAVKNYLIPACNYREELQWLPYAEEADLLNVALFGFTAKVWREANPELAAQKGLASVSMSMIADKIGIKKPSLYKHFQSKDEIVEAMYQFLRQQAKEKANIKPMDYSTFFVGETALDVLQSVVHGYIQMNQQEQMMNFYKVIYSERPIF